jgi:hypothetical protein
MVILGCEFSFITGNGNSVIDDNGRITEAIVGDWEAIDGIGVSGRITEAIGGGDTVSIGSGDTVSIGSGDTVSIGSGDTVAIGGNGLVTSGTMEYTRFNIFLPVVLSFPIFK